MGAQESKLSFRRGVFRLHEEHDIPESDPYWSNYWTLPESAEDIFTLFSANDIRKMRDEAPENFKTLVIVVCEKLFELRHHPEFPCEAAPELHMLNCLRILTRLIPYVFEDEKFEERANSLWWDQQSGGRAQRAASGSRTPTNAEDAAKPSKPSYTSTSWLHKEDEPDHGSHDTLAEELITTLVEVLFLCGFCIPANYGREKVVYGIWETGVGCTVPMGTTKQFESNKIETLRCILALISRGMYIPAGDTRDNRHITHLVMTIPKNVVLALLCSLINTTMKFNPTTWRTLPYSSSFTSDPRELLASYSLQFLLVALCYPLPAAGSAFYTSHAPDDETGSVNLFGHYFKKLHRANDFNFMVEGMSRVLHQPLSISSSYLPGSQKPVRFYPEVLLLFWESLQQNKRFRSFLIETDKSLDFLVLLLYYALQHKIDSAQIGLVRMCVFILQPLSAEARFATSLNKTFEGQASLPPPARIPSFKGTYADFLIINIYNLIATSKGRLVSLYSALFMILANVAPHVKNLSVVASTKLVQLFTSVSQPSFLFANDSNFKLLQYLLEVLNGVVEHNFSSNPHLIYAILRSHRKFEALQELTLSSGIETIQKLRKIKKAQQESGEDSGNVSAGTEVPYESIKATDSGSDEGLSSFTHSLAEDGLETRSTSDGSAGEQHSNTPSTKPCSRTHAKTSSRASKSRRSSLSSEIGYPAPSPKVISEKARGKLPEGAILHRQSSASSITSNLTIDEQHMSNDLEFSPSGDWFEAWYPDLEMAPIVTVLEQLSAEVTRLSEETPDPRQIIRYLQKATIEGVKPRNPNPRSFVWSEQAKVWFESLLFGYIYLSETQIGNGAVGVWSGTNVKLFRVQSDPIAEDPHLISRIGNSVDAVASQLAQRFSVSSPASASNSSDGARTRVTEAPGSGD